MGDFVATLFCTVCGDPHDWAAETTNRCARCGNSRFTSVQTETDVLRHTPHNPWVLSESDKVELRSMSIKPE